MEKLKNKIEAVLFSAGKKVNIEEIAKLANTSASMAQQVLNELKKEYKERDSSLILIDEGSAWKIIVKDEFLPIVKKIVAETEITKSVMETLAVIAFKYPIKQSDLIKIRTNKAYEHLKGLEEMGYITRQKHGRTKLIKLTQKFFEYFDLPEERLKEKFKDFESIAKAIEEKETEIEKIKGEQLKKAQEEKQKDEKIREDIDLIDEEGHKVPLDIFDEASEETAIEREGEKFNLEVVDEPLEEPEKAEIEKIVKKQEKKQKEKEKTKESEGIRLKPEQEKEVNKRVEEILHPKEGAE